MPIAAAVSFDLTNVDPVGSLVTDTMETLFLYKGFQHIDGMTVSFYPVFSDTLGNFS